MRLPPGLSRRGSSPQASDDAEVPASEHGPRRRLALVVCLAVSLLVVAGAGAWFAFRPGAEASAAESTQTVATQTMTRTVSLTGTVAAAHSDDLDFSQAGTVTAVLVEVGDSVAKGQALARIDATRLKASRAAAVSALDAAREQYDDLLDADADDVQVAAGEAAVVTAEDSLDSAREALAAATLRATRAGTVTSLDLAVGDVVSGTASANAAGSSSSSGAGGATTSGGAGTSSTGASTSAVRVVSSGSFVLNATVPASEVESVATGQQASLTVVGVQDPVFATVSEVGQVAETGSGGAAVFPVTIKVTGTREDLYPGTSATAEVTVEKRENVLAVSTRALSTQDGRTVVTRRTEGNDQEVTVTVGDTFGASTEITDGLAAGDVVVLPQRTAPGGQGVPAGGQQTGGGQGPGQMPEGFTPPDGASMPQGGFGGER